MSCYESFAEVYDLFMDNVPYEQWAMNLQTIFGSYQVPKGLVAELGCGTGKMTRLLSNAGYDMIGIDNSYDMLGIAMEQNSSDILYLCQDMREFELYGTVAAIVSVCDSMNYLTSDDDFISVLRLANNYLDPEGIFVFDLNTIYKYEMLLAENSFTETRDEGAFIWENYYDNDTRMNTYDLTLFIREEEELFHRYEEQHIQRAYTFEEITNAVQKSGMKLLEILDVDTMAAPVNTTERIYIVCQEQGKKR